jgi:hypothetical protein
MYAQPSSSSRVIHTYERVNPDQYARVGRRLHTTDSGLRPGQSNASPDTTSSFYPAATCCSSCCSATSHSCSTRATRPAQQQNIVHTPREFAGWTISQGHVDSRSNFSRQHAQANAVECHTVTEPAQPTLELRGDHVLLHSRYQCKVGIQRVRHAWPAGCSEWQHSA